MTEGTPTQATGVRGRDGRLAVRVLLACAVLAPVTDLRARAGEAKTAAEVAAELANPLAPVTTLAGNVRAEMGNGPDSDTNVQLRLQPAFFRPFADGSALLLRTSLPVRFNEWPVRADGLGDVSIVPYYVPDTTATTFVGYGGALILPTATDDTLGSGKWSAGPAVIFAMTGQPLTWGGLLQHVWSFAGAADRVGVSATTVQPFLTWLLRDGWAATVSSETVYNRKAGTGTAWTVPLTVGVSKVVGVGGTFVNLGLAYVKYLEHPSDTTQSELRLSATYVWR